MIRMKHLILITAIFASCFLGAQETKEKLDLEEYAGFSLEGMTGLQFVSLPGDYNPSNYTFGFLGRYNFIAPTEWISLSASSPTQMGLNIIASNAGSLMQFSADIPFALDLNLGARATTDNLNMIGGFMGGGINYNYTFLNYSTIKINSHSFGPMVHAGIRWDLNNRPMGLRVSYMWGLFNNFEKDEAVVYEGKSYPTVLTINLLYGIQ